MADWSGTAVAAVVSAITAAAGILAGRRSRREADADADATLGHGWSEFSDALREEAREERETRKLVEERLTARDVEWEVCKKQLASINQRMHGLLEWLRSMGLEPPGWIDSDEE